ncbi:MAG: ABC transporter permease [Gemmatimonadaceae bacterium]
MTIRPWADIAGMVAVIVALVALFSAVSEHFFTALTFATIANQIPALLVVAVGMTLVLVSGAIDLSVGSLLAVSGATMGMALTAWSLPLPIAIALCLAIGLVGGAVNGAIIVAWRVPSFIVTLGMLEVARGAAYLITDTRSVFVGSSVAVISSPIPGLGIAPAFVAAVLIVWGAQVLLTRTVFGRYLVAIGTNEEAVRLAGVDPRPIRLAVFALSGALAALGGVFHVSYLETVDPNAGIGLELSAIAAVVVGGTSLSGGHGSVVRSFLGVLIIALLQTGLAQAGASEPVKRVVTGSVIVAAVILDAYRRRTGDARGSMLRRARRGA